MTTLCTCCQRKLNPATAVRLELNALTGHYRNQDVHEQFSQSGFEFYPACARNALAAARSASITAIKAQQAINGSWSSTPTPAALPATKIMNPINITPTAESLAAYNKMLAIVLQPQPASVSVPVPFVIVPERSAAEQVAERAVLQLQGLAIRGSRRVSAEIEPERFQTECAETGFLTGYDLAQTLAKTDMVLAATVRTLFHRAFSEIRAMPTTLRVQVLMQLVAESAARAMRPLLLRQAGLI